MAVSSFAGGSAPTVSEGSFTFERLSPWLYKVVEADPFGQLPFAFAIMGTDKIVVIDTGTGAGSSFRDALDKHINPEKRPYVVILSHNHYDHVGGASGFTDGEICMGGRNQTYSMNLDVTSLAAGVGARVKPFSVTRWLDDGDDVWLDDSDRSPWNRLRIMQIPGHAIDHIAVLYERERRLFVGDTLYPFTAIDLCSMGSNLGEYMATLRKIRAVAKEHAELPMPQQSSSAGKLAGTGGEGDSGTAAVAASSSQPAADAAASATALKEPEASAEAGNSALQEALAIVRRHREAVSELVSVWLGMADEDADSLFDPWTLLESVHWDVSEAAGQFQTFGEAVADVAPPDSYALPKTEQDVRAQFGIPATPPSSSSSTSSSVGASSSTGSSPALASALPAPQAPGAGSKLVLGCGHVDPAFDAITAVNEAEQTLELVSAGALAPASIDTSDGSAEYRSSTLAFVLPHPLPKPKE